MFNLNRAIAEWRQQMFAAGIKTPVPLDELESHLRDEVEQQMKSGLNEERAFEAAVQKIGLAGSLKREFAKVDETWEILKRKVVWLLIGVGFVGCWLAFGQSPKLAFVYGLLLAGLIVTSFIDFKHFIIPDGISMGGIVLGLLCSFLLPQMHGQQRFANGILQSLLGIGIGAGVVYFVLRAGKLAFGQQRLALAGNTKVILTDDALVLPDQEIPYDELFYRKSDAITIQAQTVKLGERSYHDVMVSLTPAGLCIGDDKFDLENVSKVEAVGTGIVLPREAMGLGDVKFMAAIGAFLGWQAVIFSLVASSLLGSVVGVGLIAARRRQWSSRLPYGPFIALAAVIWIFFGRYVPDFFFAR